MYNLDQGSPHAADDPGLTLRYGKLQTNDDTPYDIAKVLHYGAETGNGVAVRS
jgi:hypothetical protein